MIRLRTLLTTTSLIQVVVVTLIAGGLAFRGGQRAIEPLVERLVAEVDSAVHDEVVDLVAEAGQANAVQRATLLTGALGLHDEAAWRQQLLALQPAFPAVSYFTIADADGGFFGLQVAGGKQWAHTADDRYDVFALREDGGLGAMVDQALDYDAFQRDWYRVPRETLQARWSPIYVWKSPALLSMTLSEPLVDAQGAFAGIVAVDLALADIHAFLQGVDVGPNGRVFLLERDGQLIAASSQPEPFREVPGADPQRLAAADYPDPVIASIAAELDGLGTVNSPRQLVVSGPDGKLRVQLSPLDAPGLDWLAVVAVAEQDVLGDVWAAAYETLGLGLVFMVLAVGGGWVVARWVSEPLALLSREVQLVRDFKLDNAFEVDTRLVEIARLKDSLTTMQTGLHSFQRFVPADLVRRILAMGEEATLGGESREVTVLFSDLRGYSTLIEQLDPEQVITFMNAYFEGMEEVIDAHGGVVLELLGDAILAVFGAPDALEGHASKAARCAVAMRERLQALDATLAVDLGHRIGVHTGEVVAGNIGGHSYMKYGVIGDVVNVAARLEQLNKEWGTSILVSEEVMALAPDLRADANDLGDQQLKGRDRPQRVFSL